MLRSGLRHHSKLREWRGMLQLMSCVDHWKVAHVYLRLCVSLPTFLSLSLPAFSTTYIKINAHINTNWWPHMSLVCAAARWQRRLQEHALIWLPFHGFLDSWVMPQIMCLSRKPQATRPQPPSLPAQTMLAKSIVCFWAVTHQIREAQNIKHKIWLRRTNPVTQNEAEKKERWERERAKLKKGKANQRNVYSNVGSSESGLHKFDMIGFSLWFMNSRLGTSKGLTKRTKSGPGGGEKCVGPKLTAHKLQQQQHEQLQWNQPHTQMSK